MCSKGGKTILKISSLRALILFAAFGVLNVMSESPQTRFETLEIGEMSKHRRTLKSSEPLYFPNEGRAFHIDASSPIVAVMEDNEAETMVNVEYNSDPERSAEPLSFVATSSNNRILKDSDVLITTHNVLSGKKFNLTISLFFDNEVGSAMVHLRSVSANNETYSEIHFKVVVCGISFYTIQNESFNFVPNSDVVLDTALVNRETPLFLYVFIQLPEDINSEQVEFQKYLSKFKSGKVVVSEPKYLNGSSETNCLFDSVLIHSKTAIQFENGCALGFLGYNMGETLYFAAMLNSEFEDKLSFSFEWGSNFLNVVDESFSVTLWIRTSDISLPALYSLYPSGPFSQLGGDILHFFVKNSQDDDVFKLKIQDVTISHLTKTVQNNDTTLAFVTPPGTGMDIPWDLKVMRADLVSSSSCPWVGPGDRFKFNYRSRIVKISSVSPGIVPEAGGVEVTCFGYFEGLEQESTALLLNGVAINEVPISTFNGTAFSFTAPDLKRVAFNSYSVLVSILFSGQQSNSVVFYYRIEDNAKIFVHEGKLWPSDNLHLIPVCFVDADANATISATAKLSRYPDMTSVTYAWYIHTQEGSKRKLSGPAEQKNVLLYSAEFSSNVTYKIEVLIHFLHTNTTITSATDLRFEYTTQYGIALHVSEQIRSVLSPITDFRAVASYSGSSLCKPKSQGRAVFLWEVQNQSYTSIRTASELESGSLRPQRLGMEFVIPKEKLKYGFHTIEVKAIFENTPDIISSASASFNVVKPTLIAVIGHGEAKVKVSQKNQHVMTGLLSHDPDAPERVSEGMAFLWKCMVLIPNTLNDSYSAMCPQQLLPRGSEQAGSFTLESSELTKLNVDSGSLTVKYALQVSKYQGLGGSQKASTSEWKYQEIEFIEEIQPPLKLPQLEIKSGGQTLYSHQSLPYYDNMLIAAISFQKQACNFTAFTPARAHNDLSDSPSLSERVTYLGTPLRPLLLVPKHTATAGARYWLELTIYNSNGSVAARSRYLLVFLPEPSISLDFLSTDRGDISTTFTVSSSIGLPVSVFKPQVYLVAEDDSILCADGCSGQSIIYFRVPVPGEFRLRIDAVDSIGRFVKSLSRDDWRISVYSRETDYSASPFSFHDTMLEAFRLGDHSLLTKSSLYYAKSILSQLPKSDILTKGSRSLSIATEEVISSLQLLFNHTQPTTACGRDYLALINTLSQLSSVETSLLTEESTINLSGMVYYTIRNTESTMTYNVFDYLNGTFREILHAAQQIASHGSHKNSTISYSEGINRALLQIGEVIVPTWSRARLRGQLCGMSWTDAVASMVQIQGATFCRGDSSYKLFGAHGSFSWCKEPISSELSLSDVQAVLGEFSRDFIDSSGILSRRKVQKMSSMSKSVDSFIDTNNEPSHGEALIRAKVFVDSTGLHTEKKCFRIKQRYLRAIDVLEIQDGDVQCNRAVGIEYQSRMEVHSGLSESSYSEKQLETISGGSVQNFSVTSWASADSLYGVKWTGCILQKAYVLGIISGVWIAVVALAITVLVSGCSIFSGIKMIAYSSGVTEEGATEEFIERDIDGREAYENNTYMDDSTPSARGSPRSRNWF